MEETQGNQAAGIQTEIARRIVWLSAIDQESPWVVGSKLMKAILALLFLVLLMQCGCRSILYRPRPSIKTPADIYAAEAEGSRSRWYYVGSKGAWHYFHHYPPVAEPDWKIQRSLLPDLEGYRYYLGGKKRKLTPAIVKVHKKFILLQIDEHPPFKIPFESQGYISPDERPQWNWLKESDLQTLFRENGSDSNKIKATILDDGTIEIEEAKKRFLPSTPLRQ